MSYELRPWFILVVTWHIWLLCSQFFLPANPKEEWGDPHTNSCLSQQQNATRPTTWRSSASWFLQHSFATKLQRQLVNAAEGKQPGLVSTTIHNFVFQIQSLSHLITLSWYKRKLHLTVFILCSDAYVARKGEVLQADTQLTRNETNA